MRWFGRLAAPDPSAAGALQADAPKILPWIYVGRVLVATVVFVVSAFYFRAVPPEVILSLAIAAIGSLIMSGSSAFYTHVLGRGAGPTFYYLQTLFDLGLVTTLVHVTGGVESDFASLYIAVIAYAAVLMPLASSLLVTILGSLTYVADIVWGHPTQLTVAVWLQIGVFLAVALATGWLASRVRIVGQEREVLQQEVTRLRLEAGDILRNIGSGVVTVDGDGNLIYANPAAEDLLDFRAGDYLGRSVLAFLDARSHEMAAAIARTQRTGERTHRGEGRVLTESRTFPVGMTTTALDVDGNQTPSVTAIFTDISDQKRLDELNMRTERLEAVAELSASLAHEIKNPLASIRSSVEQLSSMRQADDDEMFLGQLVIRESDRLSRLLNEFLDFARVRVALSKPVDLMAVARSATDLVRQHPVCTDQTELRVVGQAETVEGDEDLLHRVVANLVLNAVQAAEGRVCVSVEIRRAEARELPRGVDFEGDAARLRVADNGPGIPSELRDRLFDPFVTGRVGGSGLGLAVVQRAVQAHRGYVFVESVSGKGTTFTIYLPVRGSREAAA